MASKTYRVTISFDETKEQDLISQLDSLADKRQLGTVLSNLVREAADGNGAGIFRNLSTAAISANRQQFFNQLIQAVKGQDKKIDEIYMMCEDLYGLARANKAIGLESKADNLILSQFILQRQQSKLKELLGESSSKHLYESDKLLNEKEKADKIWDYIVEVYGGMIAELKPLLFKEIEIPINSIIADNAITSTIRSSPSAPISKSPSNLDSESKHIPADDDIIELGSDTKEQSNKIDIPTGDKAALLLTLMKKM